MIFPATNEHFNCVAHGKFGLGSKCKACTTIYDQSRRAKRRAAVRKWEQGHPEKKREYDKINGLRHKDRKRAGLQNWRNNNRAANQVINQRRYALEKNALGEFTVDDYRKQYKAQGGKCYYSSDQCNGPLQIDHVTPLSKGGTHWPNNIVLACRFHNCSKRDKLLHEWPEGQRRL